MLFMIGVVFCALLGTRSVLLEITGRKRFRAANLSRILTVACEYYENFANFVCIASFACVFLDMVFVFQVRDGHRLEKPEHCRRELYNIMYYCWDARPSERPTFSECVQLLEKLLHTETDYIELERFPDHSYYNIVSLSNEKL